MSGENGSPRPVDAGRIVQAVLVYRRGDLMSDLDKNNFELSRRVLEDLSGLDVINALLEWRRLNNGESLRI